MRTIVGKARTHQYFFGFICCSAHDWAPQHSRDNGHKTLELVRSCLHNCVVKPNSKESKIVYFLYIFQRAMYVLPHARSTRCGTAADGERGRGGGEIEYRRRGERTRASPDRYCVGAPLISLCGLARRGILHICLCSGSLPPECFTFSRPTPGGHHRPVDSLTGRPCRG